MNEITYHKANENDIQTLVEYRIRFAIELSGEQAEEAVNKLREQMSAYFTKATAENVCISFIAKCNGTIAGICTARLNRVRAGRKRTTIAV